MLAAFIQPVLYYYNYYDHHHQGHLMANQMSASGHDAGLHSTHMASEHVIVRLRRRYACESTTPGRGTTTQQCVRTAQSYARWLTRVPSTIALPRAAALADAESDPAVQEACLMDGDSAEIPHADLAREKMQPSGRMLVNTVVVCVT
jgi:hypothetical protein